MNRHEIIKFLISNSDKITLGEFEVFVRMSTEEKSDWNLNLYNYIKERKLNDERIK